MDTITLPGSWAADMAGISAMTASSMGASSFAARRLGRFMALPLSGDARRSPALGPAGEGRQCSSVEYPYGAAHPHRSTVALRQSGHATTCVPGRLRRLLTMAAHTLGVRQPKRCRHATVTWIHASGQGGFALHGAAGLLRPRPGRDRRMGDQRPAVRFQRYLATRDQYRHDHHHLSDGVPDPEHPEPRYGSDAAQARRADPCDPRRAQPDDGPGGARRRRTGPAAHGIRRHRETRAPRWREGPLMSALPAIAESPIPGR